MVPKKRQASRDLSRVPLIDLTNSSPPHKISRGQVNSDSFTSTSSQTQRTDSSQSKYISSQINSSPAIASGQNQFQSQSHDEEWVPDDLDTNPTQSYYSENDFHLYSKLETKIVGIRYYNGRITDNEMVFIIREPENQYDRNAIKVTNVQGHQIGHIPRTVASKLASFMDNKHLRIEGHTTGHKSSFDCPIELQLFGPSDPVRRSEIKELMKEQRLPISDLVTREREDKAKEKELEKRRQQLQKKIKQAGGVAVGLGMADIDIHSLNDSDLIASSSGGLGIENIISVSESFNPRSFEQLVEKFSSSLDHLQNMPMAEQPKMIKSNLLPYQLQGLQWLLDKESPILPSNVSSTPVQLWKYDSSSKFYTNIATNYSVKQPELASGGILADDMGLGKTIQIISLIVASREKKIPIASNHIDCTLIVAPLSVMSNWTQQVEKHVKEEYGLKVLIYHGKNRSLFVPHRARDWDIVVTTYDTIRSEHFGKSASANKGLRSIKWRRIVLDEGHIIRNPASKTATAIHDLEAQSRWALTGTPIVNTLKDLYSLVKFISLTGGIEKWEFFNGAIIRPLNAGFQAASEILQQLMNSITLRRKKDMSFIDLKLPELSEYIHRIDFRPHEQKQYDLLDAQAKGRLEEYNRAQNSKGADPSKAYRNLLEILLRMRQYCNHWQLVGKERIQDLQIEPGKCLDLTPENKQALEQMLQICIDNQEDCPVCLETAQDAVITPCVHCFCFRCIEKVIEAQHKCPMCRAHLSAPDQLLRLPEENTEDNDKLQFTETSSKLDALISILKASNNGQGNKTVVFSQWTSFLNVVEQQLPKIGIKYARIDGTMSAQDRDASMKALEEDPECAVLLASLGVCSVGLNLVAANQVILSDSWWAPAIEDQAVDRVHRLGQTRKTTVFRLVMSNSIEDGVLDIQKRKRQLMMLAFAEKKAKRGNEQRLGDIKTLLGVGESN